MATVNDVGEFAWEDVNQLRKAGMVPYSGWTSDMVDWRYAGGAGGRKFNSELDYLNWLYGPGGTVEEVGPNGDKYFRTPNGADAYAPGASPMTFNPPDSMGGQLVKAGILGLAGTALMGGIPGVDGLFSGGGVGAGDALSLAGDAPWWEGLSAGNSTSALDGLAGSLSGADPLTLGSLAGDAAWGVNPAITGDPLSLGGEAPWWEGTTPTSSTSALDAISGPVGATPDPLSLGSGGLGTGGLNFQDIINNGLPGTSAPPAIPGAGNGVGLTEAAQAGLQGSSGTALSRLLNGTATTADYASIFGNLAGAGLGAYGASQQADAMSGVADRFMALGAPFRDKLLQSYDPNFSMANSPDFQNALNIGADAAARATSAKFGNPVDNPGAYAEMQKYITGSLALPQLNTYRSQLASAGGLGVNTAGTAAMGEAQSSGGVYDALGYGLNQLTRPQNSIEDLLKSLNLGNRGLGYGASF